MVPHFSLYPSILSVACIVLDKPFKIQPSPLLFLLSVFRNGDLLCPPFRFIIPRSMQQDLEKILSLITEKVSLRTGAVRRLETPSGQETHTWSAMSPNKPTERWRCCKYLFSGCALWKERLCPQLRHFRLATATLPWEPRGSRNFHMWSCWYQKPKKGITMQGPLHVCEDVCLNVSVLK